MKHYLFAKFFNFMSEEELMEKCLELGIDGPTLMIRDNFWVTPENFRKELPGFCKTAEKYHLEVKYADTGIRCDNLDNYTELIKAMKDSGIEQFRIAYVSKKNFNGRLREIEDFARRNFEKVAEVAEKNDMQAVVQIHGGQYPHNASTAYRCVRELNPKYIGIKLDAGNNINQEGYEYFSYQIPLLKEYIAAIGEKDACMMRGEDKGDGNKGWYRVFVPACEGYTNYKEIFTELKNVDFKGPGILMPFYNVDNYALMEENLKKEIAYFKKLEKEAGL